MSSRHFDHFEYNACAVQEGGGKGSGPPPPEKSQKYRVLAILVRIPWKITKLPGQHSMVGHHRPASETSFGGPMMAPHLVVFGPSYQLNNRFQSRVGPTLKKHSGSAHVIYNKDPPRTSTII